MASRTDPTILIVDDFRTMRTILKKRLQEIGFHNFLEAADGLEGLEQIRMNHVDLIISDWAMPKMDGLSLFQFLQSQKALQHIPFVMVTAEGEKDNEILARGAGITHFIVKPFQASTLKEHLDEILAADTPPDNLN